jgi:hypothetical protein
MLSALFQLIFGESASVIALRRELAASEAKREAAEAELVASEEQRAAAEAELVASEALRAADQLAAHKAAFFVEMRVVSSQASKLSPSSGQRLAVAHQSDAELDAVLGAPLGEGAEDGALALAWGRACATLRGAWSRVAPRSALSEAAHVHPVMAAVLAEALPPSTRLWHDVIAPDDIPFDEARPDFVVAHARDARPSLLGSIVLVEVKREGQGQLRKACLQAANYMSRRMYRLCCERDARGEALHELAVFGVALDGSSVQVLRMASGAPPPGGSFAAATPCPVLLSPALELVPWDWLEGAPPEPPPAPPLGFRALAALLRVACAASAGEAPLQTLSACLQREEGEGGEGEGAAGAGEAHAATLRLSLRLGRGGSSDVYAASVEGCGGLALGGGGGGGNEDALVVKLPRWSSAAVAASFETERSALAAVRKHAAGSGDAASAAAALTALPQCLAHGWLPALRGASAPWPLLVLQPVGVPLAEWVAQRCFGGGGGGGGGGAPSRLRMQCVTAAALCCARALRAAQGAGWVHCDLRPSNIVVQPGSSCSAVLVDWGSARPAGEDCLGEGVAVFAHMRTRSASSCKAHSGLDAAALLLTWVAAAWHERCDAPWGDRLPGLFGGRLEWLKDRAMRHKELRVVLSALEAIDKALQGGAPQAGAALDAAEAALNSLLAMHGELPLA